MIRAATADDAEAIAGIYNYFVEHTIVSFEEAPVSSAEMARRIADIVADGLPWLVVEEAGAVLGYAYASKWKKRRGYRFSVESTVYLVPGAEGRGLAAALYSTLFEQLAERGVHAVIAGIALPNERSVALHEKFGMSKVAHFREVGFKFGQWIDVGYWERFI